MFALQVTPDLTLKLLDRDDTQRLFDLTNANRAYLREWLPWVDSTTHPEHTRQFIDSGLRQYERGVALHTGMWYRGQLVGVVGFNYLNQAEQTCEIGYWLAAQYQGRGLMTAACRALINHAFDTLGMAQVEIRCAVGNQRSRAIPQRLGFTDAGVLPELEWLNGRYIDAVVYRMDAATWHSQPTTP